MTRSRAGAAGGAPIGRHSFGRAGESGQAAVELLAAVPLVLVIALAVAQVFAVGYAGVLAGNAAEAGALALAGGGDARAAARAALPDWARDRAQPVVDGGQVVVKGGEVTVRLRPPTLIRALGRHLEVSASAAVEAP
jgi:hypothetical protein